MSECIGASFVMLSDTPNIHVCLFIVCTFKLSTVPVNKMVLGYEFLLNVIKYRYCSVHTQAYKPF